MPRVLVLRARPLGPSPAIHSRPALPSAARLGPVQSFRRRALSPAAFPTDPPRVRATTCGSGRNLMGPVAAGVIESRGDGSPLHWRRRPGPVLPPPTDDPRRGEFSRVLRPPRWGRRPSENPDPPPINWACPTSGSQWRSARLLGALHHRSPPSPSLALTLSTGHAAGRVVDFTLGHAFLASTPWLLTRCLALRRPGPSNPFSHHLHRPTSPGRGVLGAVWTWTLAVGGRLVYRLPPSCLRPEPAAWGMHHGRRPARVLRRKPFGMWLGVSLSPAGFGRRTSLLKLAGADRTPRRDRSRR